MLLHAFPLHSRLFDDLGDLPGYRVITPDLRGFGASPLGDDAPSLAAMADEVWLRPDGVVWIDGYANVRNYFREALEVAISRARTVHGDQRGTDVTTRVVPGGTVTERWVPVRRVEVPELARPLPERPGGEHPVLVADDRPDLFGEARGGDGRGVAVMREARDFAEHLPLPSLIERFVVAEKEIAVLVARFVLGIGARYLLQQAT